MDEDFEYFSDSENTNEQEDCIWSEVDEDQQTIFPDVDVDLSTLPRCCPRSREYHKKERRFESENFRLFYNQLDSGLYEVNDLVVIYNSIFHNNIKPNGFGRLKMVINYFNKYRLSDYRGKHTYYEKKYDFI